MIKRIVPVFAACAVLLAGPAAAAEEDPPVSRANTANFSILLSDLAAACEETAAAELIEEDLAAIRSVDRRDYALARSIADHWKEVYLDPEYPLFLHSGGRYAPELADAGIPEGDTHAIVVLGYALKNGWMQPELKGRCDAAAAMARSYPSAILVCSGGATGKNNPFRHTEAGLMKEYLTRRCGIDPGRIFIDEKALTTAENAVNTFEILRERGVRTMTIVTSSYHQRRGQTLYHLIGELYRRQYGTGIRIVGNYCYDTDPPTAMDANDARLTVRQMAGILGLPSDTAQPLPTAEPDDVTRREDAA